MIVPPPGYFARLLELCDEREMLTIFDECQTGLGRLGTMYGFEAYGVVPDFLVLSKTLGGGIPIGAVVTSATIEERLPRARLHARDLARLGPAAGGGGAGGARGRARGEPRRRGRRVRAQRLLGHLRELQSRHELIGDVRGMGLLCGIELVEDRETRQPGDDERGGAYQ